MRSRRAQRSRRLRTVETLEKRQLLFAPLEQISVLQGLESVESTLERVEVHAEYAKQIPVLETTAGELADLSQTIRDGLVEPLTDVLEGTQELTLDDVTDVLDGYSSGPGEVITQIVDGSVSSLEINSATEASLSVTATIQQDRSLAVSLSDFSEASWVEWGVEVPEVSANITTQLPVTFGIDLASDEFFVSIGDIVTTIDIDTDEISSSLRVGLVEATINNASAEFDATITTGFSKGNLSESDLAASLDSILSVSAAGSMNIELPATYSLGTYQGSETISWSDSALFDGAFTVPTLSDTGELRNLIRVDAEDVVGFFSMIGSKLDELLGAPTAPWNNSSDTTSSDAGLLGRPLPWLRDLKFPELSKVSDGIEKFVDDELKTDEGLADLSTFQRLRDKIEEWTNLETLLEYLPDTSELVYEFEIPADVNLGNIELGVDQDYGVLAGIQTTGTAAASGNFTLAGTFGIDLTELAEDLTPEDASDNDSWADHFYTDNLTLSGDVSFATESASARARIGFVEVGIGNADLSSAASTTVVLADDQTTDGRITFKRLTELVLSDPTALIQSASFSGNTDVTLSQMSVEGIPGLSLDDGEITVGIPDLTDPTQFEFEVNEPIRNINALSTVTIDQWVDLAGDVIELIDDLTQDAKWDQDIPGIGESVNDIIDYAEQLQQAIASLLDTDTATIQELGEQFENFLEDALGLDPNSLDVTLAWNDSSLEMSIQFTADRATSLPLSVDVTELIRESNSDSSAFDLLDELVDVSGSTSIDATASLDTQLTFGVDVSDILAETSIEPQFYVGDETGVSTALDVSASGLETSIAVGPLGIFVRNGSVTINADGDASTTAPASLSVGLADQARGRIGIDDLASIQSGDIDTVFDAGGSIVLPLYFPTEDDPVGGTEADQANAIIVSIGNVAGLFTDEDPSITIQAPDVNSLIDDFDPADEGLRILADGLDILLQRIETLLREQVLNQNLPLVGEQLEEAADFVRDLRENALPVLQDGLDAGQLVDEVKQVLFDALGGVMVLEDNNSDGLLDHQDVALTIDTINQEVSLDLSLGDSYSVAAGIDFDLGLPGIGLDLDGDVEASLDWKIDVGIGINPIDGFYVTTSDQNEIELGVEVTLPDASLTGTLGLFQISVADQGSKLNAKFDVDLSEPSGDGKLTFAELVDNDTNLSDLVTATLSGGANVDFAIVAGTTLAALPELHADFVLTWDFDGSNLAGTVERLAIENIQLDLGSFISGFAGEILKNVQDVLEPIEPIVDVLTEPLPVANDLDFLVDNFADKTAPYDAVNLLDFASVFGNVDVEMLDAIAQIINLVRAIPVPSGNDPVMIPLGEVIIIDGSSDPNSVTSESATVADKDIAEELENYSGNSDQEQFAADSASFIEQMSQVRGGGLQFPVIDNPASLIGVLLGQDATLFAYQTPRLSADFSMGITVPITGPLAVEFVGGIGVDAQFAFGYDTRGLRNFIESKKVADLADGFFVSDRENVDGTGADVDEVTLRGSLEAFATLTTGVASASIGGGIYATVGANLNDTDNDGKVRIAEFFNNLPLCAFDFSGSLSAGLRVKAQVLGVPFSENIATVKLLEFSTGCSAATDLQLGEFDSDGVFTLFVGDLADRRDVGMGIIDEQVTFATSIDADGNEVVEVSAFGVTEQLDGVTKIVANGADGNDSFIVQGSLDIPVEFTGGSGNDQLVGGSSDDVLRGGGGDDLIQGGSGDDEIHGGSGNDTLEGQAGNDTIEGGDRDDFIDGGMGDDTLSGGHGSDVILGRLGMDIISGGLNSDTLYGNNGADRISGGEGDDSIDGGEGDDAIEGDEGNDILYGRSGDDFLHGGSEVDVLHAGSGNDIAFGGFGADLLYGGNDSDVLIGGNDRSEDDRDSSVDQLFGEEGDDFLIGDDGGVIDFDGINYIIEVIGGDGDDLIEGGDGKDWAHGVGGRDQIFGGAGHDHLIGGDDEDKVFGGDGSDWLEGGAGADHIEGHAGGDLIGGGRGADLLDGGADEDQIYSHSPGGAEPWFISHVPTEDDGAADIVFGRSGTDEIVGGIGDDRIDAGAGNDAVLPGAGNDIIEGGLGDDYIDVSRGQDSVIGQWGNDEFLIGFGAYQKIDGQHAGKPIAANQIPNDSTNRITVGEDRLELDLTGNTKFSSISDVNHIDGQHRQFFTIKLDRESIESITDSTNTLRLDLNKSADATLEGEWVEETPIEIDGQSYRKLTNNGVTLLVTNLEPVQQNSNRFDVNGDGTVSPMDALVVINWLSRNPGNKVILASPNSVDFSDVNGDHRVSIIDALHVINELNRKQTGNGSSSNGMAELILAATLDKSEEVELINLGGLF